jgi:AbrB family looped-hinge helix DNA binding protein
VSAAPIAVAGVRTPTRSFSASRLSGEAERAFPEHHSVAGIAASFDPEQILGAGSGAVTLPAEIREALQVRSGDEIEFSVDEHGTVTVRGFTSIPTDQAWFFTPSWQAGERQADEQVAGGEGDFYASDEDFLASFPAG